MLIRSTLNRLLVVMLIAVGGMIWPQVSALAGGGWPPRENPSDMNAPHAIQPQFRIEPAPFALNQDPVADRAHQARTDLPWATQLASAHETTDSKPFYSPQSMSRPGRLEFGVMGGEPLGLSAKLWLSPTRAIDAGLGWTMLGDDTNLQLHADYLFHNFDLLQPKTGYMPLYYGMGARFRFGEDSRFGFRVPLGIGYISASRTVSLFLEAGPVINFIPTADVDVNFGLGIRYFFFQPDKKGN